MSLQQVEGKRPHDIPEDSAIAGAAGVGQDTAFYEQVTRYRAWLTQQLTRSQSASEQQIADSYATNASQVVVVGKQNVQAYAPFRYKYSALKVITSKQFIMLGILLLVWTVGMFFYGRQILIVTMTAITIAYLLHLILDVALALSIVRDSPEEQIDNGVLEALRGAEWPMYTILCPLYKEARVVPQFVKAMQGLDYPTDRLQILFLTEEDDDETRDAIAALNLPAHFEIVTVPEGNPRTKPRACNFGLIQSLGQYVVIFDAEDVPDPLQLKKAVLTFANHGANLACVQAKLNFYNPDQNLLTRWFTAEYSLWFDLILPGLQKAHFLIPLGGTSNHFPTQMIRALGGWDPFNVTEDCDLGLRLAWFKMETVVLDSTTYEEANSRTKNWLRQRSRWIKGYMQTYLVHMREPWHYAREFRIREFLSMQLMIGGKTAVLFINPLLWIAMIVSQILRPFIGNAYGSLFPAPIVTIGAVCLVVGNFFYLYIYLLACIRRKHYQLVKWTLLIPIYWLLMSVAACIALYQLIVKPHYWEKTEHGLHLLDAQAVSTILEKDGIALQQQQHNQHVEHHNRVTVPAPQRHRLNSAQFPSVRLALNTLNHEYRSAFTPKELLALRRAQQVTARDPWFLATLLVTLCASIASFVYAILTHTVTQGTLQLTQAWSAWLPLTHLLVFPFAWSGAVLHTGIMLPAFLCYLLSTLCVFIAARCLTQDSRASFVGTLLFIFNPTLLMLNTLTLNEWLCITTLTMTCCCFLLWSRHNRLSSLIGTALCSLLATLTCYDGWALFVSLLAFMMAIGWLKRYSRAQTESYLIAFGTLGVLGIGVWMLCCATLFGDPFVFLRSVTPGLAPHQSIEAVIGFALQASMQTLTPILFSVALLGLILFVARRRLAPETLAGVAFLVPFVFSLLSLGSGYVVPAVPTMDILHALQQHDGIATIAPAALFLATLFGPEMRKALAAVRVKK